jgi:hypothetical protein
MLRVSGAVPTIEGGSELRFFDSSTAGTAIIRFPQFLNFSDSSTAGETFR